MMTFSPNDVNCPHMNERYTPPEVVEAHEREAVRRRFGTPSRYFDPELFMEGYDAMAAEYDAADRTGRRTLLTNRYFDGFAPIDDQEIVDSQFEDRFVVRAPERMIQPEDGATEGATIEFLDRGLAKIAMPRYGSFWQQGPTRAYDLPPGNYMEIRSLGRQDVVGTTSLTACTAIVARKGTGLFMAHVLGSMEDDIRHTLDAIRSRGYEASRTRMFAPFWTDADGENQDAWNRRLERIADESGLTVDWFPYVGFGTHNPDDIRHTTVLAGRDALWSVGSAFKTTYQKTPRGELARQRTVIRPSTYRDYE